MYVTNTRLINSLLGILCMIAVSASSLNAIAQTPSDFTKNLRHSMALDPSFENLNEGLPFRWPQIMPQLLKFQIGDYKTVNPSGNLVDDQVNVEDKGTVEVGNAVINSILNKRKVSDYRSRKGSSLGRQRYAISLDLEGYGNTIIVSGDAVRFFGATFSTSGMAGSVETNSSVLIDTTFLAGAIRLPDQTNWNVDVEYKFNGQTIGVSGEIYSDNVHYQVFSQVRDKDGDMLEKVALIIKLDSKTIAAAQFPKFHGSKGSVLFDPQLPVSHRQAIIGLSALFFAYREILTNF